LRSKKIGNKKIEGSPFKGLIQYTSSNPMNDKGKKVLIILALRSSNVKENNLVKVKV